MNKITAFVVLIVFVLGIVLTPQILFAKDLKIGYIDLAKVFDQYSKTKDSDKALEKKGKGKEGERKALVEEIRKLKDEVALLSEKARAGKQPQIDEKIRALQDFDRKTREELVRERNEMVGNILRDIEKVVTDYSKKEGYDVILNSRMLLYGNEQYDLTDEILNKLNK